MYIPEFLYKIGFTICHQLADRSFNVFGQQLPLCSRCTGIYLGMFITFAFYFFFKLIKNKKPSLPPAILITIASIIFMILMVFNAVSILFHLPTSNPARFATGMLFGFSIPLFLLPAFNYSRKTKHDQEHIIDAREYFVLLAAVILSIILVIFKVNYFIYLIAYLSIAGLIIFLLILNATLVTVVLDEIKSVKLMPYYHVLLMGAVFTGLEMFLLNMLHDKILNLLSMR